MGIKIKEDMRTTPFVVGDFYHVFNRGVDKRQIFMDDHDYLRFYVSMYAFNDEKFSGGGRGIKTQKIIEDFHALGMEDVRERLVDVRAFCLRPNHFHMLIQPKNEGALSFFLQRLGQGYTRYFNQRHGRSGSLFQGVFQAVLVTRAAQLVHLPRYIHLNALDGLFPEWRKGAVSNVSKAMRALDGFRWSSHHTYMGRAQVLPVVSGALSDIGDPYMHPARYEKFLNDWSGGKFRF